MGRGLAIVLAALVLVGSCAASLFACSGEPNETGLYEPLRLRPATFESGGLPSGAPGPRVTAFETASTVVRPGQVAKGLSGRASPDAVAVAIRFTDLGSGYWVLPVDGPDPQNNGELTWQTV